MKKPSQKNRMNSIFFSFLTMISMGLLLMTTSCSKSETPSPKSDQNTAYKDVPDLVDTPSEFDLLTQSPAYQGGFSSFSTYLQDHLSYPQEAIDNGISGKVYASFIVETDGSLSNISIIKGIGYGCDEQVIDALEHMPAWSTGQIGAQNVRVKLVFPVEFKF